MFKCLKVKFAKIKDIKKCESQKTYDVEMKKEPHNFIANDFISHNSHSVCYAYIAFQMAYLKCYYRKYFNLAVLNLRDSEDAIQATIDDCYARDIPIHNWNINEITYDFSLNDAGEIVPGAKVLKGIGEKTLDNIIPNKPFQNAEDFLKRGKIRSNALEALYKYEFFKQAWGKEENNRIKEFLDNKKKPKEKKVKKNAKK